MYLLWFWLYCWESCQELKPLGPSVAQEGKPSDGMRRQLTDGNGNRQMVAQQQPRMAVSLELNWTNWIVHYIAFYSIVKHFIFFYNICIACYSILYHFHSIYNILIQILHFNTNLIQNIALLGKLSGVEAAGAFRSSGGQAFGRHAAAVDRWQRQAADGGSAAASHGCGSWIELNWIVHYIRL